MLKQQSEICAHDENSNRLKTREDDRSKNNTAAKKKLIWTSEDVRVINDTISY